PRPNSAAPRVPASGVWRCGAFAGEMTDTRPPATRLGRFRREIRVDRSRPGAPMPAGRSGCHRVLGRDRPADEDDGVDNPAAPTSLSGFHVPDG
ncbi:MAG: hypothetical protein WCG47_08140, partial [Dermatophilaceae bacterium]